MNLQELKMFVDQAIEAAREYGEDPADVIVSIQINDERTEDVWSDDIELTYDGDAQASGCVLHGWNERRNNDL